MLIAVDIANSFVKVKPKEGSEDVYYNTTRIVEPQEDILQNEKKTKGPDVYRLDGLTSTPYVVGEVEASYETSSRTESDRYRSPEFVREMLIAVARHAGNGDEVTLVTGLPAMHYKSEEARNDLQALKGDYTVYINQKPKGFVIKDVKVVLQPIGSLLNLALNEDGTVADEELLSDSKKLVIDIGWGTTDVAELDGTKLKRRIAIDISMQNAYQRIDDRLKAKNSKLEERTYKLFYMENQLRSGDKFKVGNVNIEAGEVKKEVFAEIASAINASIKEQKISYGDYDYVIFTGGGAEALKAHLAQHLKGFTNAILINEPQLANVRGYYAFGRSLQG